MWILIRANEPRWRFRPVFVFLLLTKGHVAGKTDDFGPRSERQHANRIPTKAADPKNTRRRVPGSGVATGTALMSTGSSPVRFAKNFGLVQFELVAR